MSLKAVRLSQPEPKTQKQVAEDLGIHYRTYQNWENGTYEPSTKDAIRLAEYFHCTLEDVCDSERVNLYVERLERAQTDKLVRIFEQLPPEGRRALMACANGILTAYLE